MSKIKISVNVRSKSRNYL